MDHQKLQLFAGGNRDVSKFLHTVDDLANGKGSITEEDLQSLSQCIETLAPELPIAWKAQENEQENELTEYVKNLRALQNALETVRCVMLARKVELDGAKRHLHGLKEWVNAYQQTT